MVNKIKVDHSYWRYILKSFHEIQDGSHRVIHTVGAKPVTVSGKVIRHMLNVFGDALQQKALKSGVNK